MKNALCLPPQASEFDVYSVSGSDVRLAFSQEHGFAISDDGHRFYRLIVVGSKSSQFCGQTTYSIQYLDPHTSKFGIIALTEWPGENTELASLNGLLCEKLRYKVTPADVKACSPQRRTEVHLVGDDSAAFCVVAASNFALLKPNFRSISIYKGWNGSARELTIEQIEEFDGGTHYKTTRGSLIVRTHPIPDLLTCPTVRPQPKASVWMPRLGRRTPLVCQDPNDFVYNEDRHNSHLAFHRK